MEYWCHIAHTLIRNTKEVLVSHCPHFQKKYERHISAISNGMLVSYCPHFHKNTNGILIPYSQHCPSLAVFINGAKFSLRNLACFLVQTHRQRNAEYFGDLQNRPSEHRHHYYCRKLLWGSSGVNFVFNYVDYIQLTVLWVDKGANGVAPGIALQTFIV